MKKPQSRWLLVFCVWVLVCGLAIVALGLWNGTEIEWNELSIGIGTYGGVMILLSLLGLMSSRGCTFCCNIGLYMFVIIMGLLVLAQAAFIITAALKESDWVADLGKKYTDEDGVDHLKKKYDEFWPFFIAFGAITAFGSLGAFLSGFFLLQIAKEKATRTQTFIRDPVRDYEDGARRRHQEIGIQMKEKYGAYASQVFKKKKSGRLTGLSISS